MSRFFHGGAGDSDSSSEEEEELYTESEEEEEGAEGSEEESEEEEDEAEASDSEEEGDKINPFIKKYEDMGDSDSDSEDGKKVVKSAKDKRLEEIEGSVKVIENAQKINDWVSISNEFDKLNRLLAALTRSGDQKTPKIYIKAVAELEDFMNEALKNKAAAKKMNASNSKALNTMKQRLRKNNRTYEADIAKYKENKEEFMVEEEVVVALPTPKRKDIVVQDVSLDDDAGFTTMGKGGKALQYTPESIFKHLRTILEARGKKNTDRVEQIKVMEELLKVAVTDYQRIKVLLTLVATRFDTTSGLSNHMPTEQWKLAETETNRLITILESNTQYVVIESAEEWDDEEKPPAPAPGETFKIPGSIVSLVERLDDELTRALQQIDPHTTDYIDRLQHEQALYATIFRVQLYFERLQDDLKIPTPESLNRVIYRRLEHVYFKPATVIAQAESTIRDTVAAERDSKITPRSVASDASELIKTLCVFLYKHDEASVLRTRAMLCNIYHHAIHNRFYQARDMLLMSHLQEHIHAADINTQVLYNRTLVQIGLCAFRAGLIYEALTALQEICGTGRLKELLAQGVQIQRYSQVTPEQERLERQRQLPFHMHINLELLEAAYLTSSMLLEIPALAATGSSPDLKKRVISKTFRRMLEYHERQIFTGPPENTRDHVMQAAKALAAGEWKKSSDLIHAIKIWDLLPEPEATKEMLASKIQEEGLRTYLFTYAPFYDTISIDRLSEMFSLSVRRVSAIVSKMIAHEEISAALDNVNKAITFRKGVELSRLQSLALTLSEKAAGLIDQNERIYEQRVQVGGDRFEGGEGRRGGRGGRGGRGRGEGGRGRGEGGRGRGRGRGEPREKA